MVFNTGFTVLISLNSASWELHQYSAQICWPMNSPKVVARSQDSNSGPHDYGADALLHDHGDHENHFVW